MNKKSISLNEHTILIIKNAGFKLENNTIIFPDNQELFDRSCTTLLKIIKNNPALILYKYDISDINSSACGEHLSLTMFLFQLAKFSQEENISEKISLIIRENDRIFHCLQISSVPGFKINNFNIIRN